SAGIKQHYSPARLTKPLLRVGERGAGEFREIEWDEALALAGKWLGDIRTRDPNQLAFFTGRDQSQALTGWWAQQFGTINYAAHGGFCSVNMAAAGMYSIGGSFWEFGEPDWERTKYLMLWGVAEDHDSNPIKTGLGKLKARGAKIVSINPVRSGYGAIADEWVPINPGSDGLLAGALIHELLNNDRIDLDYLVRYTNAHHLVIRQPGAADDGLIARDAQGHALCWDTQAATAVRADAIDIHPAVVGEHQLEDGRQVLPVFQLLAERFMAAEYAPAAVAQTCGVPASTIRRLARELAEVAFDQAIHLPQPWTDTHGRQHKEMLGRPVSMHAMRGIAAHSNGFQTCRAIHVLQMLLGAIDTPGSFRYQPPYPKAVPPGNRPSATRREDGGLSGGPLGYVHGPEDLLVDDQGQPLRLDEAFSWRYPLAAHGMLQSVIRNASRGDPYPIDTLFLFMANMGWNSAMNTGASQRMLTERDPQSGEYRIAHVIYSDAYWSETVNYADLILPDTTYLERYDCISMLDRPIADADAAADAIRRPVVALDRDVRAFQDVLLDLGARLGLPGMTTSDGAPQYRDYADYMVRHERKPGIGMLAGWRGAAGEQDGVGAPNPEQLERYAEHGCFWHEPIPEAGRYYKMANREYLEWAKSLGLIDAVAPVVLELYSEKLQRFRLAAQGHGEVQPPAAERARVARYFDPLPFWYASVDDAGEQDSARARDGNTDAADTDFPLHAISQRPMYMYHSWGSQNTWLRQIAGHNALFVHPDLALELGFSDGDWVWLASPLGRLRVEARTHAGTAKGTVWTWNAIGKARGAWKLDADAPESSKGFLLNHVINDVLARPRNGSRRYANADPVTGQAAWFDLRVRIELDPTPQVPGHRVEVAAEDAA
ncbi:MAG: molybdopterin-dependent oxidoreductase, partial [Xanthomonadales bacterium]|nr:molybdopterin-dependent oxidoreductase [Xanthomonadales bacterium]